MARVPAVRLLPVTIFVATLMLTVRVTDIWRGLASGSVSVTTVLRAQQPAPPAPPAAAAPVEPAATPVPSPAPQTPVRQMPDLGDPMAFTQSEVDLLQKLAERRQDLEARSREMDMREGLLRAAETRIDKKIDELKTVQASIEGLLKKYDDQEDAKLKSLVKIYENMKPKDAARIFEKLEMPVLLDVLAGMKEQKVAAIMAEMDPGKAKAVTGELARRQEIMAPPATSGG